jgi:CoA:oxalate CoA-transferase
LKTTKKALEKIMEPLEGIRVIECAQVQAGPVTGMLLGDLGAEVIKVEPPEGESLRGLTHFLGVPMQLKQGRHALFEHYNHNKKSIALNLKILGGRQVLWKLVEKSDIFVTNFRSNSHAKLGIDYKTLSKHNRQLIYGFLSGFGEKGPASLKPAYDMTAQAMSGIALASGEEGMPPIVVSTGVGDQIASIMLVQGILAALLVREKEGTGQRVSVSQLGSLLTLQGLVLAVAQVGNKSVPRPKRLYAKNPLWNLYECKDGKWIALAVLQSDRYWADFCRIIGKPELVDDSWFCDMDKRRENRKELVEIFDQQFATRTRDEWCRILDQGDINYCKVNRIEDLAEEPQVLENEYLIDIEHPILGKLKVPGQTITFSQTPTHLKYLAPELGEHTIEILKEICGYSSEEITELAVKGVI